METYDDPSWMSSLQLIAELENLITLESGRCDTPWIHITKLAELFDRKYQVSLEEVVKTQGYDGLRSLLRCSRRFSIYPTSIPHEFHVALLKDVVSNFDQTQIRPIPYRIKKFFGVDPNLISMLNDEGAEEILSPQFRSVSAWHKSPSRPEYQPILCSEITSVDDFKAVLVEIVKSLLINRSQSCVTVTTLSQQFCVHYQEPIRVTVRRVCPDTKLIDLVQTIPHLRVQGVDHTAQITLNDRD